MEVVDKTVSIHAWPISAAILEDFLLIPNPINPIPGINICRGIGSNCFLLSLESLQFLAK